MLKIKDNVDLLADKLYDFGFKPKYDENTGRIKRFVYEEEKWKKEDGKTVRFLRIEIALKGNIGSKMKFRTWWEITYIEHDFLDVLYDLIKADLVEKVEE